MPRDRAILTTLATLMKPLIGVPRLAVKVRVQ